MVTSDIIISVIRDMLQLIDCSPLLSIPIIGTSSLLWTQLTSHSPMLLGYWCLCGFSRLRCAHYMLFLFVGSDVYLRFPSDSPHNGRPYCLAIHFPLSGQVPDLHQLECDHRAQIQKRVWKQTLWFKLYYFHLPLTFSKTFNPETVVEYEDHTLIITLLMSEEATWHWVNPVELTFASIKCILVKVFWGKVYVLPI